MSTPALDKESRLSETQEANIFQSNKVSLDKNLIDSDQTQNVLKS